MQLTLEESAVVFSQAKQRQRDTRDALRRYRREFGICSDYRPDGPHARAACYQEKLPLGEWCETCIGAHALWLEYQTATKEVARSLRALMHRAKHI